jgi:hypothetical protein
VFAPIADYSLNFPFGHELSKKDTFKMFCMLGDFLKFLSNTMYIMSELARRMKKQTKQLQFLNEQIEVRAARRQNITLRNSWTQAKTSKNYQTEYDRIRSHLQNSLAPGQTVETINKRKKS